MWPDSDRTFPKDARRARTLAVVWLGAGTALVVVSLVWARWYEWVLIPAALLALAPLLPSDHDDHRVADSTGDDRPRRRWWNGTVLLTALYLVIAMYAVGAVVDRQYSDWLDRSEDAATRAAAGTWGGDLEIRNFVEAELILGSGATLIWMGRRARVRARLEA